MYSTVHLLNGSRWRLQFLKTNSLFWARCFNRKKQQLPPESRFPTMWLLKIWWVSSWWCWWPGGNRHPSIEILSAILWGLHNGWLVRLSSPTLFFKSLLPQCTWMGLIHPANLFVPNPYTCLILSFMLYSLLIFQLPVPIPKFFIVDQNSWG